MFYLVSLIHRSEKSRFFALALTSLISLMPESAAIRGWCKGNSLHLVINSLKPKEFDRYCNAVNSAKSPVDLQSLAKKRDRDGLTPLMRAYVKGNKHGVEILSPYADTGTDNYGYSVEDYKRIFPI